MFILTSKKQCSKCGEWKPLDEFHKHKKSRDGHGSRCKSCQSSRVRALFLDSVEKEAKFYPGMKKCTKCKEWRDKGEFYFDKNREGKLRPWCKECSKKNNTDNEQRNRNDPERYQRNLRRARTAHLRRKYRMDWQEYESLFAAQNGRCAICGDPPSEKKLLCVDHDHKTDAVRGLLCDRCNVTLGKVNDDLGILSAMMRYLEERISLQSGVSDD